MRVLCAVGARPNFVKMAPVIAELGRRLPDGRHVVVHTGQHHDRMTSDVFVEELSIRAPDHVLGVGSGSHVVQTARVMERIEPELEAERPELVIVPGDVNSTLGGHSGGRQAGHPARSPLLGLDPARIADILPMLETADVGAPSPPRGAMGVQLNGSPP